MSIHNKKKKKKKGKNLSPQQSKTKRRKQKPKEKKGKKKEEERKVRDREARATSESARRRETERQRCRRDAVTERLERQRARESLSANPASSETHAGESETHAATRDEIHLPLLPPVAVSRSAQPSFEPSQNHNSQNHKYLLFNSYLFLQISKPCESVI